nr:winged helix-turn-helix transcriptional regulator [Bacillus pacificus]
GVRHGYKPTSQVPPKVDYSLSERGCSLIPLLDMMCEWGEKNNFQALEGVTK